MGDRHGGCFARRGRALNPHRPQVDAPLGESLPTRRTSKRICPHARRLPSAKASRHGARAKGFAPRRNALLGESIPTRRTREGICPAQEYAPRRRPPDTARRRKDLCRAGTRPSTKASRHGARAKGFVPRRNTPLSEGLPTRRTSEGICPAQEHAPRRRPPDTARRRKDLPAQEHAPRRKPPDTAHERRDLPRGGSRLPHVPTNGGTPSADGQPKNTPSAGSHPQRAAAAEFIHRKK